MTSANPATREQMRKTETLLFQRDVRSTVSMLDEHDISVTKTLRA